MKIQGGQARFLFRPRYIHSRQQNPNTSGVPVPLRSLDRWHIETRKDEHLYVVPASFAAVI